MRTLCLIRCNAYGETEAALARFLKPWFGENLVLAADCRDRDVQTTDLPTLSLTDRRIDRLGLYRHPKWGWRCGDYALIAAAEAYPDITRFWLVEPDVFFAFPDARSVFAPMDLSDVDLISNRFRPAPEHWVWTGRMRRYLPSPYSCQFPLVRASAGLISDVAAMRRRMTGDMPDSPHTEWPNDEVVTASVAAAQDMRTATFRELLGPRAVARSFSARGRRLFRLSWLQKAGSGHQIFHPAYNEERFFQYLDTMARKDPDSLDLYLERIADSLSPAEVVAIRQSAQLPNRRMRA